MKNLKKLVLVFAMSFFIGGNAIAQDRPTHELHAMMIYNFLKYVQWPGELNTGEFVIGVLGDDKVFNTLNTWYGNKEKGGKKLIVKNFSSVSQMSNCQLLYIGDKETGNFGSIKSKLQGSPTLTVSGKNGMGKEGSCINFKIVNNRLRFELNQSSVDNNKLKVSSQLTSMAILI